VQDRIKQSGQGHERRRLNELIDQLSGMVDRVFLKHGFNLKTLKFDNLLDRKTEANRREPPTFDGNAIPACPICGVVPHNLSIHDEWRRMPGAKSEDKIAADREATGLTSPLVSFDNSDVQNGRLAHDYKDGTPCSRDCPACRHWIAKGLSPYAHTCVDQPCYPCNACDHAAVVAGQPLPDFGPLWARQEQRGGFVKAS
jgi:hypothetical protein